MGNAIYAAMSGASAQNQYLDIIANNLANSTTTGFKSDDLRFGDHFLKAQQMQGNHVFLSQETAPANTNLAARNQGYVEVLGQYTDLAEGAKRKTDQPLDVAIEGKAFFQAQFNGQTYYTRDGRFRLDDAGELALGNGAKILDEGGNPIRLESGQVEINSQGVIFQKGAQVGKLGLFNLPNEQAVKKAGYTFFSYDDQQAPAVTAEKAQVLQGFIEESNVNPMREMTRMIQVNRAFEIMNKVVKTFRELDSQSIADIGGQRTVG